MGSLIILVGTFAVFWLLFIRPQQARVRAHQALVASLEEGDSIVTTAGIYGTIRRLDVDDVVVEVAPGVEIRMARQAVARRADGTGVAGAGDPDLTDSDPDPGAMG